MARPSSFLAVDIGASKVVVAEFSGMRGQMPRLLRYGIGNLDLDPEQERLTGEQVVQVIRRLMRDHEIHPGPLLLTISGQAVFPRYVKLPPVGKDKLLQIIRYEAEQNVPFPIQDVVWDYQLLEGEKEEVNVMLVAVKTDNVTLLTDCMTDVNLEPEIVDAAPMALYNVIAHNYPDEQECTMVLDIGARSSNVIFIESGRIFTRSVPVAGNAITLEIAKELNVPFGEAEVLKRTQGQVGLGGVTTLGEEDLAERMSKIIRSVVTRLHAEVNRSINFYRGQQRGNPPARVFLCGGSAVLPNLETFFEDKLRVPVEPLNPFLRMAVDEAIPEERIQADAHLLGEVVGLALRRSPACAVEINLMPPSLVASKEFRSRLPFIGAAAGFLVLTLLALWTDTLQTRRLKQEQLATVNEMIRQIDDVRGRLAQAGAARAEAAARADSLADLIERRSQWYRILAGINGCMLEGMWLTRVLPAAPVDGVIPYVDVTGKGFEDQLRKYDSQEVTAVEAFRDRLRSAPMFSDETNILKQPILGPGDYTREFTIRVIFEKPLKVGEAG